MSFLSSAQESLSSNKAEELDDSSSELKPREFFWDNIVLFVVSSIVALAAVDVVTEFIRGGDVSCFSPQGVELNEAQAEYLNNYCSGFLPPGAYIPAFMVIHALFISILHYLWLSHFGGNFDFFFNLSSSLKRLREEGEHVQENRVIVSQLEATFGTYNQSTIFTFYKLKLVAQLLWSIVGIVFVAVYFFSDFNTNFRCPGNFNNETEYPFWPLETDVVCVFETLSLLQTLWVAEIALLAIVCLGILWALVWCYSTHSTELGAKDIARFSFQSGLSPVFYIASLPVPSCCRSGRGLLLKFFTSLPGFSRNGPRIRTDVDFLLMKLYRTDNGLGHVFKEVQVEMEIRIICEDDQRRLYLHANKQKNLNADNANERKKDTRDREHDEQDLKWRFSKEAGKKGVYRDFKTIPTSQNLLLTSTVRGAVLGFGQRAPTNKNALAISFGDVGFGTALARAFSRVASLNFSPHYTLTADTEEVVKVTQYRTHMVSLVTPDSVLSSQTSHINKFVASLGTIWTPPGTNSTFSETSFIVVGPIPRTKDFNLTNVDLLFEQIHGCLEPGAVLLTLRPLEIAGKRVENDFISYEPNKQFEVLRQEGPAMSGDPVIEWPARKSVLEAAASASVAVSLQEQDTEKSLSPQALIPLTSCAPDDLPWQFTLSLRSGVTKTRVQFSVYSYTNSPPVRRPKLFEPPKKVAPPKATPTTETKDTVKKSEPIKEKNVNLIVES